MNAVCVPGNHDEELAALIGDDHPPHPFFHGVSAAFIRDVGDKRLKFMHGHEVDPFITPRIQSIGRIVGAVAYFLEFRQGTCILTNDTFTEILLEIGEQILDLWGRLTRRMNKAIRECYQSMPAERIRLLTCRVRTHRMLGRYHQDRADGWYDAAIVGHTHKAGVFDDWYYNSGSWTGTNSNFLRISPDGSIGVFDWSRSGPQPNQTVVAPGNWNHQMPESGNDRGAVRASDAIPLFQPSISQ